MSIHSSNSIQDIIVHMSIYYLDNNAIKSSYVVITNFTYIKFVIIKYDKLYV